MAGSNPEPRQSMHAGVLTPVSCCCHSEVTGSYSGARCGGGRGCLQPHPLACARTEPETTVQTSSEVSSDGERHLRGEGNIQVHTHTHAQTDVHARTHTHTHTVAQ